VQHEESASAPEAAETPADTDTAASAAPPLPDDRDALIAALKAVQVELEALREGTPMVFDHVDGQAIADVVANWTGIPVGKMMSDEIETIRTLKQQLEERIIGQSHALDAIAQSVRTARVKLKDPKKPVGVFLMVGTSGVGKTETTMALGDLLYGGEQNVTVINMSEFKEEHKVSLLMGSPPGYVGYGEGGVLTEAVRRRPHGIVLLDEMEKAHAGVQDVFYQVFDKGSMRDGEGRDIDFRNTMIVMTSNAGTQTISHLLSQGSVPPPEELADALRPELLQVFKPAFLGRLTLVPYLPLSDETLKEIVRLQLGRIEKRVAAQYDAAFAYDEAVVEAIAKRCTETDSGARTIDQILNRRLLPDLAFEFLSAFERPEPIRRVHIGIADSGAFHYEVA
jgi:type VI secretion system protein VasG